LSAVFPKGPSPPAKRGIWHPSGLSPLGAKGYGRCRGRLWIGRTMGNIFKK